LYVFDQNPERLAKDFELFRVFRCLEPTNIYCHFYQIALSD
jgi:hypothetical protein